MTTHSYQSDVKNMDSSKESSISSVKIESNEYDDQFERRTIRKIDLRILPILSLLFAFALIDRTNLGTAHAAGMGADLHLAVGTRFNIVTLVFFVPYILLELPGNIALRKFGVRRWMTFITFGFGSVQLGMGFVNRWGYLALCRVFLGIFEASLFPSIIWIISSWYKRHEVQKRLAAFLLISVTAGGLSPLMAYVFSQLDGRQGIPGWQWIFILEGIITLSLGFLVWFFIPEFPEHNTFLTPEETELVLRIINEDRGDAVSDPVTWEKVKLHLKDWTLFAYGAFFLFGSMPSYAQSFFMPIIFRGMGWSKNKSMLLSAPPYGPTIFLSIIVSYWADRLKHRGAFIFGTTSICAIGLAMTAFLDDPTARYIGCFLINAGNGASVPCVIAYGSNNVVGASKRAVSTSIMTTMSGIGGVICACIFRAQDGPRYIPGLATTMVCQGLTLLTLAATTLHFSRQNRLLREGKRGPIENTPGFFYTL